MLDDCKSVWLRPIEGAWLAKEQDDENDDENKRDATAAVVADSGAHAIATKAEDKNKDDEKKNHGGTPFNERFHSGRLLGLSRWMRIVEVGEEIRREGFG
jgi:hypothetical protein